MQKLRQYLNRLPTDQREPFASRCGTSEGYLRKAISKGSELGPALSALIETHSGGEVTRIDLHPDSWWIKWPELAEKHPELVPKDKAPA